jgi:NAD(P)H-dependent flavin oxidoreductase YrpB (nitropropane dioxygenase family)
MLEAERSQVATGKLHPGGDAQMDGDLEAGVLTVGMSSYLIDDIQPAGEIVRSVVRQAITTLGEATRYVYP